MSTVQEIESAIDRDAANGKLDSLADEALCEART
jgi:hypothetical protein